MAADSTILLSDNMKKFRKIYIEISNVCNLNCSFCPGTRRQKMSMTSRDFQKIVTAVKPYTDFVYFHLMGEPLLHPELKGFLHIAALNGLKVIITTNGTLLHKSAEILLSSPALHKVNISLHSFEANDSQICFEEYLHNSFLFGQKAEGKKLVVYRLWNQGGSDLQNQRILQTLKQYFPKPWIESPKGTAVGNHVFLEYGEKFDWPDMTAAQRTGRFFCYGLRDQIGILCDGTVVPCCLDHEGDISLGNILEEPLEEIFNSPRAREIYMGFSSGIASEELCKRCGYADRFK